MARLFKVGLIFIFLAMVVLVNPVGDFPLNDDWSYGLAVERLLRGHLELGRWSAMTLIGQVLWGTLFAWPLGFSFTALRISTLVLALGAIITTYLLLLEVQRSRRMAFFGALVFLACPLFFPLANSFMTDVPFVAVSLIACLFYLRGGKKEKKWELILGSLFATWAILIRQLGLILPLAFCLTYKKKSWKYLFIASILPIGVYLLYILFFQKQIADTTMSQEKTSLLFNSLKTPIESFFKLISNGIIALIYVGFLTLPFSCVGILDVWKARGERSSNFFLAFLLIWLVVMIGYFHKMPYWGNTLYNFGLGAIVLHDKSFLHLSNMPHLPNSFWIFFALLGMAGTTFLIKILFAKWKKSWVSWFFVAVQVLYFLPLGLTGLFDRYVLLMIPCTLVLLSQSLETSRLGWCLGSCLVAIYLLFTIAGTRDYLAWNRARWQGLNELVYQEHIPPEKIDGGLEFNGLYLYDRKYPKVPNKSWWWVQDDEYIVTMGPVKGYREYKSYPYYPWIPLGEGKIYILKRDVHL